MDFDHISMNEKSMVESAFSEEEVWKVLLKMEGDKAPSPDGFIISLFRNGGELFKMI